MSRKLKIAIVVVLIFAFLGFTAWLGLRPKFQTASRAEIDRNIDPDLLRKRPPDPAAERRFARLVELTPKFDFKPLLNAPRGCELKAGLESERINAKLLAEVTAMTKAGPLREPLVVDLHD